MRRIAVSLVATALLSALLLGLPTAGSAAPAAGAQYRDGVVLVGFDRGASSSSRAAAIGAAGARLQRVVGAGTHVLRVPSGSVEDSMRVLRRMRGVRYAEPDHIVRVLETTPNDPRFKDLWGLYNNGQAVGGSFGLSGGTPGADIDAKAAWDFTRGSRDIVVGVVDTGISYSHPDLAANMWKNPGGIGGCAAGTFGYNAFAKTCDPRDDQGHGTHVAGTIGAVGNNGTGVAGVNWTSSLMALRFLDSTGSGFTSDAIIAIDWAIQAKQQGVNVRVLNNSWGGGPFSLALLDVVRKAGDTGILFVASAGNGGGDGIGDDNDTLASYPCSYGTASAENPTPATNVVCVAATENNDALTRFSNYGDTSVDLAAPGAYVYSTTLSSYGFKSGTSMAAPHVAGGAALILAQGYQDVATLRSTVVSSIDPVAALGGKVKSGGRFNVCRGIAGCVPPPPPPDFTLAASPTPQSVARGKSVTFSVTATPRNSFSGSVRLSVGLPSGTTASFSANPIVVTWPNPSSSTLTVSTSSTTNKATYILTIKGVSGGISRTTTIKLTVY